MAAGASGRHHIPRAVHLGGQPVGVNRRVAGGAGAQSGGDVVGCLAGGCSAVVASRAIGSCGKGAVVDFGAKPGGVGRVAGLTRGSGHEVGGRLSSGGYAIVATGASRGHDHIDVELGG